jgi:hypothetical protein
VADPRDVIRKRGLRKLRGGDVEAVGLYWLSRIPVEGSYVSDLLPGLLVAGFGVGGVFVGATTAANAGVDEDKAGLAAGLLNTGQQVGTALGLAILSAVAIAHTDSLLSGGGDSVAQAATSGYGRALVLGACFTLVAGAVALLARRTRPSAPADSAEGPPKVLTPVESEPVRTG